MSKTNLLICCNRSHLRPALICAHSFIKNSEQDFRPAFGIDESISDSEQRLILQLFPEAQLLLLERSRIAKDIALHGKNPTLDLAAYYRIYAIQLLSNQDPTLYVDTDTICVRPLFDLPQYTCALEHGTQNVVAACSHMRPACPEETAACGMDSPYLYINSGVLLFLPDKAKPVLDPVNVIAKAGDDPIIWRFADQGILNKALHRKILYMDYSYNVMTWHFIKNHNYYDISRNFLPALLHLTPDRALSEAKIIHYTTTPKPWTVPRDERAAGPNKSLNIYSMVEEAFFDAFGNLPKQLLN